MLTSTLQLCLRSEKLQQIDRLRNRLTVITPAILIQW